MLLFLWNWHNARLQRHDVAVSAARRCSATMVFSHNDRHTVVCSVRENLECRAMHRLQGPRRLSPSLHCDLRAGQLGVETCLLAARWILIAQPDKNTGGSMNASIDAGLRASCINCPGEKIEVPIRTHGLQETVERSFLSLVAQYDECQAWTPDMPEFHLSGAALQEGIRGIIEARDLAPCVTIGVPTSPVVILAAPPAVDRNLATVHCECAGVLGVWGPDQGLCLREPALVQRFGQQQQWRLMARVAQRPLENMRWRYRAAVQGSVCQRRVVNAHVQLRPREAALRYRNCLLHRSNAVRLAIEIDRP